MADTPRWHLDGDWFDVCKCDVPCPCEFARSADRRRMRRRAGLARAQGHLRRRQARRVQRRGARLSSRAISGRARRRRWASSSTSAPTRASARRCRRSSAARRAAGRAVRARASPRCAASSSRAIEFELAPRSRALARRRGRQGRRPCRSVDRPDDATGPARADDQSTRLGSRSRRRRDLGRRPRSIAPTRWASSGAAADSRASTSRSTGTARTDRAGRDA